MNVLMTGASGFTGRHVVPVLLERGHKVVATARSARAASVIRDLGGEPLDCDLDDALAVDDAFRTSGADALITLSSLGDGHAPALVAAAAEAGINRGVFTSSTAIFTTVDAPSKPRRLAGELAVTGSPLDWTVIRPTMIYGAPGDRNLERLLHLMARTPVLPMPGGGERLQQPVHVDDLALAFVCALERDETVGRCYDVAGPDAITFRELLEQAAASTGRSPRLMPVPLGPVTALTRLYEQFATNPRLKTEQIERLSEDKAFSIDAARRDLGFEPRSFASGIAEEAEALGVARARAAPAPRVEQVGAREHFEDVADGWVRRYEEQPSFVNRLEVVGRVVLETLDAWTDEHCGDNAEGPRVLDVGGGPGVFSAVASGHARSVTLLDVSEPMVMSGIRCSAAVETLASRLGPVCIDRVQRVAGSIDALLHIRNFDVVLAIAVLEYLDDPGSMIVELASRLRSGGRLILTIPNPHSVIRRLEDMVGSAGARAGGLLGSERLSSRAYAVTRPHGNDVQWRPAAERAGLAIERVEPLTLAGSGLRRHFVPSTVIVLRSVS